jgi:ubiquinone/menaquinone biosynthesis C-methylase UbiE
MDEKSFKTRQSSSSKDVLDFYDEYAETWDRRFGDTESTRGFHTIRLNSFLKLANLDEQMTAVELGVGTGPYVFEISSRVAKLVCVDGSKEMLKVLEQKIHNNRNVRLEQINLSEPLDKVDFAGDVIYFFGLVEHIIEIDIFIENCKKMLKEGGKIIVISANGSSPWYYGLRKIFRAGSHCTTDKYFSRQSLKKVMANHGLIEDKNIYWGFFPAGISGLLYNILKASGKLLEKTPLKVFGGGMSISYKLEKN